MSGFVKSLCFFLANIFYIKKTRKRPIVYEYFATKQYRILLSVNKQTNNCVLIFLKKTKTRKKSQKWWIWCLIVHVSNLRERKKMAAVHFTTIPCEPNIANRHIWKPYFWEIRPCTNNIVYARFEVFRTFLCVFMSVFRVFVR